MLVVGRTSACSARVRAAGLVRLARDGTGDGANAGALPSCYQGRTSLSSSAKPKKKKKRQKSKKSAAPSKKDLIRQSKRLAVAEEETMVQSALRNLDAKSLQANLQDARNSFRDYAESLFSPNHERARKAKLHMDFHWWKWNLLMMVSPSVLLALYCQYVRPEAEAFHREQRALERRRIMGDDWSEEVDREIQEMERLQAQNLQQSLFSKILSAIADLTGFNPPHDSHERLPDNPQPQMQPQTNAQTSTQDKTETTLSIANQLKTDQYQNIIASLLKRIEILEARLGVSPTSETNQQIEQLEKQQRQLQDKEHRIQYLRERSKQSPIQNRAEDRQIDQWKKEREERLALLNKLQQQQKEEEHMAQQQRQHHLSDNNAPVSQQEDKTMTDIFVQGIKLYTRQKMDKAMKSARDTLNEMKGQITGSHENDKDTLERETVKEAKDDRNYTDSRLKESMGPSIADQNSLDQSSSISTTLVVADAAVEVSKEALNVASESAAAAEAASLSAAQAAAVAAKVSSNTGNNTDDLSNVKEEQNGSVPAGRGNVVGRGGSWISNLVRRRPQEGEREADEKDD